MRRSRPTSLPARPIVSLAATMLAAALVGCAEPPPPNLLIISVDTLRADALGYAGYSEARTPNLDALAARGTNFTQAIAPVPRTTPALGSLLTGLEPKSHGSRDVGDPIREGVRTLAEILRDRGYSTMAVSANDSAGPEQGLDRGFESFVNYRDLVATYGDNLYVDFGSAPPEGSTGWAAAVTEQGLILLADAPRERPYFLWLFYFDPHFLYNPPSPWQNRAEAENCWKLYSDFENRRNRAGQVFFNVNGVADSALEDCRALYDEEIAYTDAEIGHLLEVLGDAGALERTVIVFVADHGENFGEGGLYFEHGDNVHDAGLRVPLVFVGEDVAPGLEDDGAVTLADVVPTLFSLLGVPEEERPQVEGLDLTQRLRADVEKRPRDRKRIVFAESAAAIWNEATSNVTTGRTWWRVCVNGPRYSLCEIPKEAPGIYTLYDHVEDPALTRDVAAEHPEAVARLREAWTRWPPESARQRSARTSRFKLVQTPQLEGGYSSQLFDLHGDPGETTDVCGEHSEVCAYLLEALERWSADLPPMPERENNPELEESLRNLGYLP